MKETILLLLLVLTPTLLTAQNNPILPKPLSYESHTGAFTLTDKITYSSNTPLANNALHYLLHQLERNAHYTLKQAPKGMPAQLTYLYRSGLDGETYTLEVKPHNILINASSTSGFFYGTISLMQLMDANIWGQEKVIHPKSLWSIKSCYVTDAPYYKWRGMMLDSARNFFSKAYVKKFIDRMAQHKLNVFHWHLTDDEGWRIEIKKYPLLTEIGAQRGPGTKLPFSLYPTMRGPKEKVQKGFYTQEDIKEIVAYAEKRSVHILPEIDIPAHAKAAVISYPELLQDPNDRSNYISVQKVSNNTIDPGLKSSYIFLEDVIEEVVTLFPYKYIHLGGDEVPKGAWKGSPSVKKLMQKEHLKNSNEVQAYFFSKMDKILKKHHRNLIGWQEIQRNHNQLRDETIIMAWRGDGKGIKSIKHKKNVIFAPAQFLYFDQQYVKEKGALGHTWAGPTNTKEVYSYQPLHTPISSQVKQYVKGIHAVLWSEHALNENIADYLVWPRALALSEVAWSSPNTRVWLEFQKRMTQYALPRLEVQNINYYSKTH